MHAYICIYIAWVHTYMLATYIYTLSSLNTPQFHTHHHNLHPLATVIYMHHIIKHITHIHVMHSWF